MDGLDVSDATGVGVNGIVEGDAFGVGVNSADEGDCVGAGDPAGEGATVTVPASESTSNTTTAISLAAAGVAAHPPAVYPTKMTEPSALAVPPNI